MPRLKKSRALPLIRHPKTIARLTQGVRVEGEKNCWVWQGYRDRKGYGQIWYNGRAHWSHRVAYAVFVGEIPEGLTVNHDCMNTSCCNPDHLSVMSRAQNTVEGNRNRASHKVKKRQPDAPGADVSTECEWGPER